MRKRVLLLAALACVLACDGGCERRTAQAFATAKAAVEAPPSCEGGKACVKALTWNVALGKGMNPLLEQRVQPVADALAAEAANADVICIQEAWGDEARDAIVAKLGLPPANVYLPQTAGIGETGQDKCEVGEFDAVAACSSKECGGKHGAALKACVQRECKFSLLPLLLGNHHCLNCLIATAAIDDPSEVNRICTTTGASRIQGGRTGLILASRWPLRDAQTLLVPASNANRGALMATIDVPGVAQPLEVACTHLAASDRMLQPSHSGAATWSEEKLLEVNAISRRLTERAAGRPQMLIGDMNSSPSATGKHGDAWEALLREGFSPPAASLLPSCTSCGDNTFRLGKPGDVNDHVLLRDPPGGNVMQACAVERLFDRQIRVVGDDGTPVGTHLSDHYGLRVTVVVR